MRSTIQDRFSVLASLPMSWTLLGRSILNNLLTSLPSHEPGAFNSTLHAYCSEHDLSASDKIQKLHNALKSSSTLSSPLTPPRHTPTNLSVFSHITDEEVSKIISQSCNAFCDLDPTPTSLLKQCLSALLPT